MNPPAMRPPSRFVRGRARGGGAYRPYFYFRRNGRTIPAGGQPNNPSQAGAFNEPSDRGCRGGGGSGGWRGRRRYGGATPANSHSMDAQLDSSFLRPDCYAAPKHPAYAVQSIATDSPLQCRGWRLYFPQEAYQDSSDLVKRIKAAEAHYTKQMANYELREIQRKGWFTLQAQIINGDEALMNAWPSLLADMRLHPERTLATLGVAMHNLVTTAVIDSSLSERSCNENLYVPRNTRLGKIYIRAEGFANVGLIANIESSHVDTLYCVRGTVAAMGAVEATATWIAYKCSRCRQEQALRQPGYFVSRPYSCKCEGCLAKKNFVEQRSSPHTRITPKQIIRLAESQLQRLTECDATDVLDVELQHDLVDAVFSGQDVVITGILKLRALSEEQQMYPNSNCNATNQIYLKAITVTDAKCVQHNFTSRDMDAIAMINAEPDSFKLLVHSLAPELCGEELAKAGVLLALLGGAGSQIHEEAEINVLLVGDPGIGKSHMLDMCSKITTRGALVSGKRCTASSNPLTAAIQGRTNYIINSGAVIAAIMGHCSIDDIDRLASQRETLLQVMQSQIISLPFSCIYANIHTPTSIIATANSLRGHYDHSKLLTENTRLSPALLQQFHLVFLLLDKSNKDLDTLLTEHIKAMHAGVKKSATIEARFAMKPKTSNSMNIKFDEDLIGDDENYDLAERLKLKLINCVEEEELDLLPPILMKKFIAYARHQVRPLLNDEAAEALKSFYMGLRQNENEANRCAASTRHLEGLIRLTQARARLDFSTEATKLHVRDVLCIVRHSIADTALCDYMDTNPASSVPQSSNQRGNVKKFVQMLQMRSSALGRRIFDYDELKDMASRVGITCGVSNLVDTVNMQGYLLKRGPNMYEVMGD